MFYYFVCVYIYIYCLKIVSRIYISLVIMQQSIVFTLINIFLVFYVLASRGINCYLDLKRKILTHFHNHPAPPSYTQFCTCGFSSLP